VKRRLKKSYTELFDNPAALWPDCKVTLWPNGVPEIWLQNKAGTRGVRITAGEGPSGFGITITRFTCTPPLTVNGNLDGEWMEPFHGGDAYEVTLCQYNGDEHSQQFKKWYAGQGPHPDQLSPKRKEGAV
jgi:hypothetical protein